MTRTIPCTDLRCEDGAVFVPGDRFYTCATCDGAGTVEAPLRWWHVFGWYDITYVLFCVAVILSTYWLWA